MQGKVRIAAVCCLIIFILFSGSMLQQSLPTSDNHSDTFNSPFPRHIYSVPSGGMTVQLTASVALSESQFDVLQHLTTQFEEEYPQIQIQLEQTAYPMSLEALIHQLQLGTASDVILVPNDWVNDLAAMGLLTHIPSELSMHSEREHFSAVISQLRWNGYTWGVPKDVEPYALAYNEPIMQQFGISPENLQRMDGLIQYIQSLAAGNAVGDGHVISLQVEDSKAILNFLMPYYVLWQKEQQSAEMQLESLIQASHEGEDAAASFRVEAGDVKEWLEEGQFALTVIPASQVRLLQSTSFQSSPLPAAEQGGSSGIVSGHSFVVTAGSEAKEEALLWLNQVTSVQAQLEFYDAGGAFPTLKSAYEQADWKDALEPIRDELERGQSLPGKPGTAQKMTDFSVMWSKFAEGEISANALFGAIESIIN
ncbi:extracellular solute-binding protein [Marinicrinis lubricantis]|uniref:Extracellular solute-binding protein n=1 Tax=Marinicrinis lubricantis TaxID=2086470 RepID=A0ABW1IUK2_9BACL